MHVYIGYFASQADGKKLVGEGGPRFPENSRRLALAGSDGTYRRVIEATLTGPSAVRARYVVAWYDVNGSIAASDYTAKFLVLRDAALRGRSGGAVVVLTLDPADGLSDASATDQLRRFAAAYIPVVQKNLWAEK